MSSVTVLARAKQHRDIYDMTGKWQVLEDYGKQVFMYLQTKIHIYREEELHSSPEQPGGFDLLEEVLESTLQTALDPH